MNQVNEHELTVMVHIDGRLFRNFALFDTFRRQRKWVSPALFAAIMIGFSCVCFALRGQAEQAVLLGGTLLAVGLLLPAAYFLNFFLSVRTQVKKLGLTTPSMYTQLPFRARAAYPSLPNGNRFPIPGSSYMPLIGSRTESICMPRPKGPTCCLPTRLPAVSMACGSFSAQNCPKRTSMPCDG